jgi:hypothetical protein
MSYFPLQVGNKWVYSFYNTQFGQSGRFSRTITLFTVNNGHVYYNYGGIYKRVDSLNANVYNYSLSNGCQWSPNDIMMDSLSARLNDTIRYNCGASYKICSDTNMRLLFGSLRRTKNFRLGNNGIIYVKDFGIMEFYTQSGNNFYVENLIGCIINGILYGDTSLTGINQISLEVPDKFSLEQNYPNPFNPSTKIKFQILKSGIVKLAVFDVLGREIQVLVNQLLSPGTYEADFDGSNLPSGVYYYKLESEEFSVTKKMVVLK